MSNYSAIFVWIYHYISPKLVVDVFSSFPNKNSRKTRSSWLNCALRDDEAVYWVSIGHSEAVEDGNWWYRVSRGHLCLYILHKVEIWSGVTNALLTTLKDGATQLLIKYKSGALVTQLNYNSDRICMFRLAMTMSESEKLIFEKKCLC